MSSDVETRSHTEVPPADGPARRPAVRRVGADRAAIIAGRHPATWMAIGAVLAGLYAVGALLPFWVVKSPEAGSALFPPAGVTLAVLLLTRRRTWPWWLAIVAATEMSVDLSHGQNLAMALGFALANTAEPLLAATLIQRSIPPARSFRRRFLYFGAWGLLAGPALGALIGATVATTLGDASNWWAVLGNWWLGDALGVLVIAMAVLAWAHPYKYDVRASGPEILAVVAATAALTLIPALIWDHPLPYTVLPVLIWAALRGGTRAVTAAGLALAAAADWAALTGRAEQLLPEGSVREHLAFIQAYLAVTIIAALVLAVEVAERRASEHRAVVATDERIRAERMAVESAQRERQSIAREIHDIIGHTLNVILLQAGAARRLVGEDPPQAVALLESLEAVGRNAFRDLDLALGLTDGGSDGASGRGLAMVPHLVDVMRGAGMHVDLRIEGEPGEISTLVDWSGYRIVQEALTNVAKHAPAAAAHVTVRYERDAVHLTIEDDGGPSPASNGDGHDKRGHIGMRGRVNFLAGRLEIGPRPGGGYAVDAVLPVAGGSS
jgi:signal transduction histidine kinase